MKPPSLAGTELYDPAQYTWSAGASLGTAGFQVTATLFAAGVDSGDVLVAGGHGNDGNNTPNGELWAP